VQLRLLAQRGAHDKAPAADELVAKARESGEPQHRAMAFAAATPLLLARGQPQQARALLAELDQVAKIRVDPYYDSLLPELVRSALALGDAELAARLADGVEPRMPLAEHALAACRPQLAEAAGDHALAAGLYAEAAERWREFGHVPERGYALLGQGRCLLALGDAGAEAQLAEARDLFASLGYKPALAETEAHLHQTTATPSEVRPGF
jgi:tetratricopeptide (TPR) repeat protein